MRPISDQIPKHNIDKEYEANALLFKKCNTLVNVAGTHRYIDPHGSETPAVHPGSTLHNAASV